MAEKPTFNEATKFWLKLGFISFGGPAGQVAIMHEFLVEKKKWISESKFLHALNYCMILPGPEAQQLATYIGWMLHGTKGGLIAGLFFILPSMIILLGLSMIYVSFGNIPWIYAMFNGLKPAVIAIVILALIKIGKKSLLSPFHYFVAITAFIGIFFFSVPFPLIILATIFFSTILKYFFPELIKSGGANTKKMEEDERGYSINKYSKMPKVASPRKHFLKLVGAGIVLWILPFLLFFGFSNSFEFWRNLSVFFTQAAFVTFGGAYAVLPYVAQVSVEKFNWLTNLQMIDGLALGETTPGPLIMVLVFVGFMAGYNQFGASLTMRTLGLVTTTFFTFLPCFLFIFIGAPLIEKTQENKKLKEILSLVTAAVVGVVLNLTIYLGKAVLFPASPILSEINLLALGWIVVSFVAMYRMKINMIAWIGISGAFGLISYLILGQ